MTTPASDPQKKTATARKRRHSPETSTPSSPSFTPQKSQRRFTEEDEISLLTSLLHPTTNPFPNSNFSVSQISDKLRRLKLKYHKLAKTKSSIKTPHDSKIHEMGREIWGKKRRISSPKPTGSDQKQMGSDESCEEINQIINWSDFPFLIKRISIAFPETVQIYKEGLRGLGLDTVKDLNDKWMEMELEEAEIMAKKAELRVKQLKYMVEASKNNAE